MKKKLDFDPLNNRPLGHVDASKAAEALYLQTEYIRPEDMSLAESAVHKIRNKRTLEYLYKRTEDKNIDNDTKNEFENLTMLIHKDNLIRELLRRKTSLGQETSEGKIPGSVELRDIFRPIESSSVKEITDLVQKLKKNNDSMSSMLSNLTEKERENIGNLVSSKDDEFTIKN